MYTQYFFILLIGLTHTLSFALQKGGCQAKAKVQAQLQRKDSHLNIMFQLPDSTYCYEMGSIDDLKWGGPINVKWAKKSYLAKQKQTDLRCEYLITTMHPRPIIRTIETKRGSPYSYKKITACNAPVVCSIENKSAQGGSYVNREYTLTPVCSVGSNDKTCPSALDCVIEYASLHSPKQHYHPLLAMEKAISLVDSEKRKKAKQNIDKIEGMLPTINRMSHDRIMHDHSDEDSSAVQ